MHTASHVPTTPAPARDRDYLLGHASDEQQRLIDTVNVSEPGLSVSLRLNFSPRRER